MKRYTVSKLDFSFYTRTEIEKISAAIITSPITFDTFGHPIHNGLYDPHLGPVTPTSGLCLTCKQNYHECPGHFGHIILAHKVINPLSFDILHILLNSACYICYSFKCNKEERFNFYAQLIVLKNGFRLDILDVSMNNEQIRARLADIIENSNNGSNSSCDLFDAYQHHQFVYNKLKEFGRVKKCVLCERKCVSFKKVQNVYLTLNTGLMMPSELEKLLMKLYENEKELIDLCFFGFKTSNFFMEVLPVTPTKFRPLAFMNGKQYENSLNETYYRILKLQSLQNADEPGKTEEQINTASKRTKTENTTQKVMKVFDEISVETKLNNKLHDYEEMIDHEEMIDNEESEVKDVNKINDDDLNLYIEIQQLVITFFDSSKKSSRDRSIGIKQILEKKDGLFRRNLMGKRVNYAARSVISPDPYLSTREIGIPLIFAETLVFPEFVTPFNIDKLRTCIVNGPKYPGAKSVELEMANATVKYDLSRLTELRRSELAARIGSTPTRVYRHMHDNDVVLVNRQPTLHKPSIMSHRVKILPGEKTIRLHYANCNSYNADFDGDEMNIHFMQDHISRAEGYFLMSNDQNYLVSTCGSPVRGLVQDHIVVCSQLCLKGEFLCVEEFMQYIVECSTGDAMSKESNEYLIHETKSEKYRIYVPSPAILRPVKYYTGKQVITSIIKSMNINLDHMSRSKLNLEDNLIIIKDGELLQGIIDKNQIGPTKGGLIHRCGEIYGYSICNELLTSFGRVINKVMIRKGFGARIDDVMLTEDGNNERFEFCKQGVESCHEIQAKFKELCKVNKQDSEPDEINIDPYFYANSENSALLDSLFKAKTSTITSNIMNSLQASSYNSFPYNNFSLMVLTGAKGSLVNLGQISGALGQQELEGKRVPYMYSGTTLPRFKNGDFSPQAGGFIFGRFLDGIAPYEYFFHCMAGREGLIDTAVKTARSGYLQRSLIKAMEDCVVQYDLSVRFNGNIVQFIYGEDGRDPIKSNDEKIEPGEAVGIIAAQSIGEPSTQMTLNTFHLAGVGSRNVTLGIPRMVEILMVAGKTIKTPIIKVDLLTSGFSFILEALESVNLQDITKSIKIIEIPNQFNVDIVCEGQVDVNYIKNKVLKMLNVLIKRKKRQMGIGVNLEEIIVPEEKVENVKESNSSSDSDENISNHDDIKYDQMSEHSLLDEPENEHSNEDDLELTHNLDINDENELMTNNILHQNNTLANGTSLISFKFATENTDILLLPLIEKILPLIYVKFHKIRNPTINNKQLTLEGSDISSLVHILSEDEFYTSYTNDITANLTHLGIEAARASILIEVKNVFDAYGISIDPRHLMLISDFMTRNGTYRPLNRHGMKMTGSLLQKMCFESCFTYLKEGVVFGESDGIKNPSSELCVGKHLSVGTRFGFDLLYEIKD